MRAITARLVRIRAEVQRKREELKKSARSSKGPVYIDSPPEPVRPISSSSYPVVLVSPPFHGTLFDVTRQLQLQGRPLLT